MQIVKYIILAVIFLLAGFVIGTLVQPIWKVLGHDRCLSCPLHKYTQEEVQDINDKIHELGLQDTYVVPYEDGRLKVVIYEFRPWGKKRIDKKYILVRTLLPLCEHLEHSSVFEPK